MLAYRLYLGEIESIQILAVGKGENLNALAVAKVEMRLTLGFLGRARQKLNHIFAFGEGVNPDALTFAKGDKLQITAVDNDEKHYYKRKLSPRQCQQ